VRRRARSRSGAESPRSANTTGFLRSRSPAKWGSRGIRSWSMNAAAGCPRARTWRGSPRLGASRSIGSSVVTTPAPRRVTAGPGARLAPGAGAGRLPDAAAGRGHGTERPVTIHRPLRSSWCPLTVTLTPGAKSTTPTPGANQKLRIPIRSQRSKGSQVTMVPVMENRRGSGASGEGNGVDMASSGLIGIAGDPRYLSNFVRSSSHTAKHRMWRWYPTLARPAQESPATLFTTEWIDGDETQEALESSSI
jgi:hypothetical protein